MLLDRPVESGAAGQSRQERESGKADARGASVAFAGGSDEGVQRALRREAELEGVLLQLGALVQVGLQATKLGHLGACRLSRGDVRSHCHNERTGREAHRAQEFLDALEHDGGLVQLLTVQPHVDLH